MHEIDLTVLAENAELRRALEALPGRRLVFTNGSRAHAERVLARLGIADLFEGVCDIAACDYVGKPERAAYDTMLARHGVAPDRAIMFDDRAVNLAVPHALGMQTVLIGDHGLPETPDAAHVHFHSLALAPVLAQIEPRPPETLTPKVLQSLQKGPPNKGLQTTDLPQEP